MVSAQSGFVIENYLITAAHGIVHNKVCVAMESKVAEAKVLGLDRRWDIAILASPFGARGLKLAKEGPSLGDVVLVVGMNRGSLNPFASIGVVSSTGLSIEMNDSLIEGVIQIHSFVPRGVSGASVVNYEGHVVGMIVGLDYGSGCAYAVPNAVISRDIKLIRYGIDPGSRPRIGLKLLSIGRGLYVMSVEKGSIADRYGLKRGDVIVACCDKDECIEVNSLWDLWGCIDNSLIKNSAKLRLWIIRKGTELSIECLLNLAY